MAAYTAKLGSSSSKLGNIKLGLGATLYSRSVTSTLTLTQIAAVVPILTSRLGSTLSYLGNIKLGYDAITPEYIATNTLTLSQDVDYLSVITYGTSNNYINTHSVIVNIVDQQAISHSLTLSQDVHYALTKNIQSVLTLSHSVSSILSRAIVSDLDIGHILYYPGTYNKSVLNYFQYYQTLQSTKTLNVSASNTLTLTNIALGVNIKEVENVLVFNQTAVGVSSKLTSNTLTLTQTLSIQLIKLQSVNQLFRINQTVIRNLSQSYRAANAIGFNQTIRKWKQFDLDVDNTLTLTHEQVRERFDKSINSTITFTQTANSLKIITLTPNNTLMLTQAMSRGTTINRALSHQIVFLPTHEQYIPIGSIGTINIPNLIVTNIHQTIVPNPSSFNQDVSGNRFIIVPRTPKRIPPYSVLQVPERAITLPTPEWNDNEAYSGIFTIRRSMIGGTVTYVHRLDTDKLKYDLVLGTRKAHELEDYLLNYNSRIHTLTNWKGEIWYVYITNSPMDLVSGPRYSNGKLDTFDDREKVRITLEFEGKRIN